MCYHAPNYPTTAGTPEPLACQRWCRRWCHRRDCPGSESHVGLAGWQIPLPPGLLGYVWAVVVQARAAARVEAREVAC